MYGCSVYTNQLMFLLLCVSCSLEGKMEVRRIAMSVVDVVPARLLNLIQQALVMTRILTLEVKQVAVLVYVVVQATKRTVVR